MTSSRAFKGNKQSLPSKPCARCGRPMSWRKAWARCWDEVRYCSERCRRTASPLQAPEPWPTGAGRP